MFIVFKFVLILLFLFIVPVHCLAQSLIVGVPSSDTMPEGELYLTHESQFGLNPKKWNSFNFLIYGLDEHTEVSGALFGISDPMVANQTAAVGFKRSHYLLGDSETNLNLKGTFGSNLAVGLNDGNFGTWTYAHLATRIPKLKTRLTAGVSYGNEQVFGRDVVSGIFGIEQPFTKRLSFVADWYTGTHDLAAFIPALQWRVKGEDVIILGVKIPNNEQSGNPAIIFEINKRIWTFGKNKKKEQDH